MIIATIIFIILTVLFFGIGVIRWVREDEGMVLIGLGVGAVIISVGCLSAATRFEIGTSQYTGYIYSTDTVWGYTTAHIRFSEQAGQDEQPSICFYGEEAEKAKALTGTGVKVKIYEEGKGFTFVDNPFACGSEAYIEEVENETKSAL